MQRWYAKLGLNAALICVDWGNLARDRLEMVRDADLDVGLGEHGMAVFSPDGAAWRQ